MILVVDDDSSVRAVLTEILTERGHRVRAADTGELALASIALQQPNLILLDVRMPGMDGFEVCRRLKARTETRDIPVILLSASSELSERVQGFQAGAVDFVNKPFQREELLARVGTHVELGIFRAQLRAQVTKRTEELHESEWRFQTMADAAPVMIWVSDRRKLCTFFNKPWLEFTGRAFEQELGDGWAEGVHRDDIERCYAAYSSAFDRRVPFKMEYRLRRADGEYRWVLDMGSPRFAPEGRFAGYVGSCIDITDLKQDHERMLAAQKLESLGLMAAGIGHDFGNLLMTIFVETDMALSKLKPASAARSHVERIYSLTTCASEIVKLLRASAGGAESNGKQLVDVSALVQQTLQLITGSISKRAAVRTSFQEELPPIRGNSAQIRQVVMNLITNASEALGDEPGSISINVEKTVIDDSLTTGNSDHLAEGEYVHLTVSDTGCGISAETRARIFDQFFTTKALGRGLGLAAVRGIVRSHEGAITVESTPGNGTTFKVLLPCAAAEQKLLAAGR